MKVVNRLVKLWVLPLLLVAGLALSSCGKDSGGEQGGGTSGNGQGSTEQPQQEYVKLNKSAVELSVNGQATIVPEFSSEAVRQKGFTWTTDKPDVIAIANNADGSVTVTALSAGVARLSIEANDQSLLAACQIAVFAEGEEVVRILGIGNSFTVNAMDGYLYDLMVAGGKKVVVAYLAIGGATLEDHLGNAQANTAAYQYVRMAQGGRTNTYGKTIADVVASEPWDYICFQQQSWLSGQFASYQPYIPALVAYVKSKSTNPDAVYAVLQTWAFAYNYGYDDYDYYDNNQLTMHAALVDAARRASQQVTPNMMVVPAGTAIQNGRTTVIGDGFCSDGYHLNSVGCFTVACTWYEAVFGDNVSNNPYKPQGISDYNIEIAKAAARYAVQNPEVVTDMVGYK